MKQRIITGIILLALALAGLFYLPANALKIIVTLIVAAASWEYINFFEKKLLLQISFLIILLVLSFVTVWIFPAQPTLIIAGIWWVIAPYFLWRYTENECHCFTNTISQWALGWVIFIPCLVGMIEIYEDFGVDYLLYALAIVWAADIGAYFAGRSFGKRKLAAKISPKKTIEGLIGGVVASLIVAVIGGFILHFSGLRWVSILLLTIVVSLWSALGDLFESMLKRQANIKDSGKLLPGHGGVYDRIDGLTSAMPLFALGLLILN